MNCRPTYGRITVSVTDRVASVLIDNPRQRNALTRAMCIELQELMPRLDADPDVIIITLRGTGTHFSAGANIGEFSSVLLDLQPDGTRVDHLSLADRAIGSAAKPTVALVDGTCMGGGWQIASACDFIIASERSVFAITPAKLGVIYPRTGLKRLARQVGTASAKYILFTGEAYSAHRAQSLGLVAETVPDDEFEARCKSIVSTVRANSQFSVHTLKRLLDLTASDTPEVDQDWDEAWVDMAEGPDLPIGVTAFLAREPARFTWSAASAEAHRSRP